jgi:tetratricopeptide (TPR) repeat protein
MEPHNATNWVPGIIVLAIGLFGAILFVLSQRKSAPPPKSMDDLDERYNRLLAQLKEHAAGKHLLPAADWQAEQARLEQAAAAVLRERGGLKHEENKAQARAEKLAKDAAADTGFFAKNPALKGALVGGGVVAFFAVLGVLLTQQTQERREGMGPTGKDPAAEAGVRGPMQQPPDNTAAVNAIRARVQANPDDIEVLSDAAGELIKLQQFQDAFPIVERASGIDPFHVQTRIWRAVLEAVDGKPLPAVDELEHLGDTYDNAYKARLYAGMIALETNQEPRALTQLEKFVNEAPPKDQPPFVRMAIGELRQAMQHPGQP